MLLPTGACASALRPSWPAGMPGCGMLAPDTGPADFPAFPGRPSMGPGAVPGCTQVDSRRDPLKAGRAEDKGKAAPLPAAAGDISPPPCPRAIHPPPLRDETALVLCSPPHGRLGSPDRPSSYKLEAARHCRARSEGLTQGFQPGALPCIPADRGGWRPEPQHDIPAASGLAPLPGSYPLFLRGRARLVTQ